MDDDIINNLAKDGKLAELMISFRDALLHNNAPDNEIDETPKNTIITSQANPSKGFSR